jgi:hypothetical protein
MEAHGIPVKAFRGRSNCVKTNFLGCLANIVVPSNDFIEFFPRVPILEYLIELDEMGIPSAEQNFQERFAIAWIEPK